MQAGHEKTITGLMPMLAGANIIYGPGMLESGMTLGYAQLVADNEFFGIMRYIQKGFSLTENDFAIDLVDKIGPGGYFINEEHTLKNMKTAHAYPNLMNRDTKITYDSTGQQSMMVRATEKCKDILANHKVVPIPDKAAEEVSRLLRERRKELGVKE